MVPAAAANCDAATTRAVAASPVQAAFRPRGPLVRLADSRKHLHLAPVAVAAAGQQQAQEQQARQHQPHPPPQLFALLQDPAKIAGASKASVGVQDCGGDVSLDAYMRLPTEQYHELDPQMILALGGKSFLLKVPRVSLFNVWVEPEVEVTVRLTEGQPGVVFESGACRLKGSDLLERLKLNDKFVIYFHTLLTWAGSSSSSTGAAAAAAVESGAGEAAAASGGSSWWSLGGGNGSGGSTDLATSGMGEISALSDVQVWSEVVGPFKAIPRAVLQATGNAVLATLTKALLPVFLEKLAADYRRWSTDADYRARRSAAGAMLKQEQ